MFVNKIVIVVKFYVVVKIESMCGCCFYRNLRVIGCFFFGLIFLIVLIWVFCLILVLVIVNIFFLLN